MSRILVTGATGFVGRALLPVLLQNGHTIIAAVRRPNASLPSGIEQVVVPDIGPETDWQQALFGVEAVVHAAAHVHAIGSPADDPQGLHARVNRDGTRRLAEASVRAGVRRFVFVSTIKVNGEKTLPGRPFHEDDTPRPETPYGIAKWQGEQALAEIAGASSMSVAVVRPPLVYGPGVGANFRALLRLCRSGLPLPLGGIDNSLSFIAVENLADILCRTVAHPAAANQTFVVRDGEDFSTSDLVRRLRAAMGRPPRLFPVPAGLLRLAGGLAGRGESVQRLLDFLTVDDGKLRRVLGWTPPVTPDQALTQTAAWFDQQAGRTGKEPMTDAL